MKRLLLFLFIPAAVWANGDQPAQTPTSNRAFEIITNAYQGSVAQNYYDILDANGYEVRRELIAEEQPDSNDATWTPEITVQDVKSEIETAWGAGRWEGHAGDTGLAVEMFAWSAAGKTAWNNRWDVLQADPYWAGKVFKGQRWDKD